MKVDPAQAYAQRKEIQDLVKNQRAEVIQKEGEIANIKKLYEKKKEDQRVQGERELVEVHDNNQQKLLEAVDGQSEKLEAMRTNLLDTKMMLDKEHDRLVQTHQDKLHDVNNFYNDKFEEQFNVGEQKSKDINHQVNLHIKDINADTDRNILRSQNEAGLLLGKVEYENAQKVKNTEENYARLRGAMDAENSKALRMSEKEHQKMVNQLAKDQMRESQIKTQIHQDQIKNQEAYYTDLLKQKDIGFKQKVDAMTQAHEQVVGQMKLKFQKELDTLVKSHAHAKEMAESKASDPFYRIETIDPEIKDLGDHYEVMVKVPETEKENVNVSAHKRKVTVSFARRFQERMEDEMKNETYLTSRSEGSRKEMPVKDIIDSQHIEQKYQDGVLTFKIKKA